MHRRKTVKNIVVTKSNADFYLMVEDEQYNVQGRHGAIDIRTCKGHIVTQT
jgi:hypothetical protein